MNNLLTKRQAKKEKEAKARELVRKMDKVLPACEAALRPVSAPPIDSLGAEAAAAISSD